VRVVVTLEEGSLSDRSRALRHPTVVIPTGSRRTGLVGSARRLRRVLRSTRPSVVHANGIKAAVVAGAAALGTGIPVVWLKFDFYRDGLVSAVLARTCAQVIGVSESVTRTFGSRYDGKVQVVNSGVPALDIDREHARSVVLDQFSEPAPEQVVTLVGRLEPDKGHFEVLELIPLVLAHRPRTRFLFVGGEDARSTPYGRMLIRRARELGLEQSVSFLPHRADAATLMAGSDLLVHASVLTAGVRDTEGLPLVALESMLAKTPVVGYANGGLPELLAGCGRIVPRGDRAALAEAILELLGDDALRAQLAERGRERVLARFLLPANVEAMKGRYRAAAGRAEREG
jgi:glycosyltransferase involved in cell wall biosynthesis